MKIKIESMFTSNQTTTAKVTPYYYDASETSPSPLYFEFVSLNYEVSKHCFYIQLKQQLIGNQLLHPLHSCYSNALFGQRIPESKSGISCHA